ncbi:phospholipase C, phosphocholine-specific [Sphingobacterium sp. UT-1RO-CII-1]|uniref:phosphocholine-specific phospholipase C n=1 Tax=Sphingobacterium sp. UT-1RO-CII-1 TaxID=2995225 RepID=UPI00227A3CB5|nr:phospholipase C, phosphocholine-specific [Sphingobacterium sp. UT-1RO-CII-1]MCY4781393.1 phospholipase C, phosphocholine-specific [Sphingobacterium sp. UT-1RO-CII-1]
MENRREFIKKAGLLAGAFGMFNTLPESIQAALKINPTEGSTYLDAEHIVMLMQENRSFDHSFGALKGVRGFNDPRAVLLPNLNPVWLQSYKNGDTYLPFQLDIKNSNAAWTRDLPHSWENQIGSWNNGKFDNWLEWKRSGNKSYHDLPLTLGHYNRNDIPFYYAFADAFTICDQHFCSSITGTTTNRHFFWTGKCVPKKGDKPLVRNSDVYYNKMANWKTFPERLEENNISWKVYQNEISLQNDLTGEADSFLGNFTDNNLEWFEQYQVRYKKSHIQFFSKRLKELPLEIKNIEQQLESKNDQKLKQTLQQKKEQFISFQKEYNKYNTAEYAKLDDFNKALHEKAFQTNEGDEDYHNIEQIEYNENTITVPKGDIFHQFRKDVNEDKLPTISWLVAPQNFSDHPSAPMYGAWYVSEVLNILTKNPDIWKKTIFILNYDENDGYFDHVPPFVAPKPGDLSTGITSPDLDYTTEYVTKEQEIAYGVSESSATEGPVGLGYRVPLIIASPWSKGGWVNSEVFDITSTIQFVEQFLNKKYKLNIVEENISSWRRAITGDLTSAFRPYKKDDFHLPTFLERNEQIAHINKTKNNPAPNGFKKLTATDISAIKNGERPDFFPKQEKGYKPSNALKYELYIHEKLEKDSIFLQFEAANSLFKTRALGAAFNVYAYGFKKDKANWSFATSAGKQIVYNWDLTNFTGSEYTLALHGPNGFYRLYAGDKEALGVQIAQKYDPKTEEIIFNILNQSEQKIDLKMQNKYATKNSIINISVKKGEMKQIKVPTRKNYGWYDILFSNNGGLSFKRQYAGRLENGKARITDPLMA